MAESLIKGTDFAYKGVLHPGELKQTAVQFLGPFVIRTATAQNFMRNTLEELTIAYPHTPLTEDHGGSNGPKAGERFLDSTVVRHSDKSTVRLSELARKAEWILWLFAGANGDKPLGALAELQAEVSRRYPGIVSAHVVAATQSEGILGAPNDSMLIDALHKAHAKLGVTAPTIYLVRPDNYIGYRGPLDTRGKLIDYLDRFCKAKQIPRA